MSMICVVQGVYTRADKQEEQIHVRRVGGLKRATGCM